MGTERRDWRGELERRRTGRLRGGAGTVDTEGGGTGVGAASRGLPLVRGDPGGASLSRGLGIWKLKISITC